MDQRLLPFPRPRQPPPQIEPKPVPVPILRKLLHHPPQQRNPIAPPHPRQTPPQDVQRIRPQLAVRQHRRRQPLLRLRPPPPPQRIRPQPVRSRGPRPRRHRPIISNRLQRLLPIPPRLNRRRPPHRRQPIRQLLQRLPRNPRKLLGRPQRDRHKNNEGPTRKSSTPPPAGTAGLQTGTRGAPRRARRNSTQPHAAHLPEGRQASTAPQAWNAGFSRHSPPPAGEVAYVCSPRSRERRNHQPPRPPAQHPLGAPASGRHRPRSGRNHVHLLAPIPRTQEPPTSRLPP